VPGRSHVQAVPGTPFGLMYIGIRPLSSGPAIGSLIFGIGSLVAAGVLGLFGLAAASQGAALSTAPAFALLAALIAVGSLVLGGLGLRQVRRSAGRTAGRGVAIAGLICGAAGLAITVLTLVAVLALDGS
jgi:hypothetical protein